MEIGMVLPGGSADTALYLGLLSAPEIAEK